METKKRLSNLAVVGFALAVLAGGAWWQLGSRGPLALAPSHLEFEDVRLGEIGIANVIATNVSDTPQRIDGIELPKPFHLSLQPFELAAGESRVLSVSFAPQESGPVEGRLALKYGRRSLAAADLEAKGVRAPEIAVEPPFLFFGEVQTGHEGRGLLSLANRGDEPLEVELAVSEHFRLELAKVSVAPNSTADIEVLFRPVAAGAHAGSLHIASTDPRRKNLSLPLNGIGTVEAPRPAIEVSPGSLDFGQVPVGAEAQREVSIRNSGSDTLRIIRVADGGKGFDSSSVPLRVLPGRAITLPVAFSPTEVGRQFAPLVIYNNDPKAGRSLVMLEGEGVEASAAATRELARSRAAAGGKTASGSQVASRTGAGFGMTGPGAEGATPLDLQPQPEDEPQAPKLPPIGEGSMFQLGSRTFELFPEDFGAVEFDGTTASLEFRDVLLPGVDFSFGEYFDFTETGASGHFDANGEVSIQLPLTYVNRNGQTFEVPVTLTTGTTFVYTHKGQVVVAEGSPLTDGTAKLVAVAEIGEGNLIGKLMRMEINVQIP